MSSNIENLVGFAAGDDSQVSPQSVKPGLPSDDAFSSSSTGSIRDELLLRALRSGRVNAWDWDLESDVVSCSPNAQEFWGRAVGAPDDFMQVVHDDDIERLRQESELAFAGLRDYDIEYRLKTQSGTERWVRSRAEVLRDPAGVPMRLIGTTQDITDLKRAENISQLLAEAGELLGSSLEYESTLTNLSRLMVPRFADWYAVDLLSEEGSLLRVSVAHPDPQKVALANLLYERYPPRKDVDSGSWGVIATGRPEWAASIPDELLRSTAQDEEHLRLLQLLDLRSYICVPLIARGRTLGAITLVYAESGRFYRKDDLRLAEDLARRAATAVDNAQLFAKLQQADQRKNEFLAMLAHELRNPLAPMAMAATLVQRCADDSRAAQAAQIIQRQAEHMSRLVDDLLDVSRVTRGLVELDLAAVDMKSVVSSAIEQIHPLMESRLHALQVATTPEPTWVEGDRARLVQVLANLLNNAAKYTQPGGRVELSLQIQENEVCISVHDNGRGIDRALLPHVFELFTQGERSADRTQGGLGIGLSLVRSVVLMHNGQIQAESPGLGQGSTFTLRLPRRGVPADTFPLANATSPPVLSHPLSVLVVDDNADAATTLSEVIRLEGYLVITATSSREAIAAAKAHRPEVFILDIGLPDVDGLKLARMIREDSELSGKRLFIALTGYGQTEDRHRTSDAGFDAHMVKPADIGQLLSLLSCFRTGQSAEPALARPNQ